MVVFNNKLTKSKKCDNVLSQAVQTGFSTLLLKRKSNGVRRLLGNILNLKHTHTYTSLVLDFDYGYRI